jgi:hypothetical protein
VAKIPAADTTAIIALFAAPTKQCPKKKNKKLKIKTNKTFISFLQIGA